MKKEIPEDIQAALTRRWVSVGALAQELCRRRIVSNIKAGYRFLRCAVIEAGGQRISAGRKSWITLSGNPAPTAELRALEEWASVPREWRKNHSIQRISDLRDYIHAALLGALAYQGDEAAIRAFEKLRREAVKPFPVYAATRGRGNPIDVFCYGEKAKNLEGEKNG
ncbi:MAG: hypothetical protein I3J00_06615 [Mesosutterella multiformis]|jgi:hypothetical protein|nr:hypothetical protein [Mesosutterella multiformis]